MTHCFRCDAEVMPIAEVQTSGIVKHVCPTCSAPMIPDDEPAEAAPVAQAASAPKLKPQPPTPKDVLAIVRDRRAEVAKRIEELRGYESELVQLDAMLSAVDALSKDKTDEAVPVLRPVRAAR